MIGPSVRVVDEDGISTVRLSSPTLAVSVVPARGAEIRSMIHRPTGIEVLARTPWTSSPPADPGRRPTNLEWLASYAGGWQVIFPSGGDACTHQGADHGFHGEASVAPWRVREMTDSADAAEVVLETDLFHSPFRMVRTISVDIGGSVVVEDEVTNAGPEVLDFMWGHHPAFGDAFLDGTSRIEVAARTVTVDDDYDPPGNTLVPGSVHAWPIVTRADGRLLDLSIIPGPDAPRSMLAYLSDLERGWARISNAGAGLAVEIEWPADLVPYAWFWQELGGTSSAPWYGRARMVAIEPSTSIPGHGLASVVSGSRTHRQLAPSERFTAAVRIGVGGANGRAAGSASGPVVQG